MAFGGIRPARFARDQQTLDYYDRRAGEYDQWYLSEGLFADRDRPGWNSDLSELIGRISALPTRRTIDIACGTGFLTQHVPGVVVALDYSEAMVGQARRRVACGLVRGDALGLGFQDGSFDRVFTGHFYGHLGASERVAFLAEAARVATELVVVDSAIGPGRDAEVWQRRTLNDGSVHEVYKRYFTADGLAEELGGEVLYRGSYFVAARSQLDG